MISYLLKSATCLALLLFFYHMVLEKEKMHSFNRFYLLGSIAFSFLAPLYIIYIDAAPIIIEQITQPTFEYPTENINQEIIAEESVNYTTLFIFLYLLISSILLIRFGRNLFLIIKKTKNNIQINYQKAVLILVDDKILPHTFWKYIFINKNDYENKKIEKELFTHELTHVTQKHTIDILILELLQAIFWINPFFILLKKAVQLNHEFLADENVISQHKNTFQYQHLLLNKAAWKNEYYLASNLNYSLTKKRLKMMTTQSSQSKILLKKLAVIPLLAGFVFLFAQRVEAQEVIIEEKETPLETIYEEVTNSNSDYTNSEVYKEYVYFIGRYSFEGKDGSTIVKKYSELTKEEKEKLVPPPPLKSKKKIPTQELLNKLKDEKKYAVWIDGKVISNSVLSNYKNTDFSGHFVSFVHKNARSKKFPQEYQAHLQTKKYFLLQNQQRVNRFLNYLKEKNNIEENEEEKNEEIKEKKRNYPKKEFIDSPIQKYNYPSTNGSKQSVTDIRLKLKDINNLKIHYTDIEPNTVDSGFKLIKGKRFYFVTIEGQTKLYNKEGKPFDENGKLVSNKKAKASEIIPDNYVKKVFYKDEVFCEFEDDKPKNKEQETSTLRQMKALFDNAINKDKPIYKYNKTNKYYEALRNKKPHYINSTDKRKEILDKIFSQLGTIYFKLSNEDKRQVERPIHPFKPYVKLKKNGQIFYKLKEELTKEDKMLLPPPPPKKNTSKKDQIVNLKENNNWEVKTQNNSNKNNDHTLKLIEKLAKKGAKFYYEDKLISASKALKLAEQNPKMRVESESTNNSKYVARLLKEDIKEEKPKQSIQSEKKRNKLDIIIDMAKNDAKFYYEKQPISSDKAIELLKKDKSLNVHSEVTDFYSFKVWISKNKKESSKTKSKLSDFEIDIKKQSDKVILKCNYGCDWKELTFTLKDDQFRTNINQFGKSKDKNDYSSFWFYVNYNFGRVELISNKGAAWKQLGFNLTTNGKINQFGVKRK